LPFHQIRLPDWTADLRPCGEEECTLLEEDLLPALKVELAAEAEE
jgi:hypothetical protein